MRAVCPHLVLFLLAAPMATAQEHGVAEDGFVRMFNGVDFSGWHVSGDAWLMQEGGVIHCTGGNGTWMRSDLLYEDLILRLEYKISPGGNSGVFLHAPLVGRQSQIGLEMQIRDDYGRDPSSSGAGALYKVMTPAKNMSKPAGEWNEVEITWRGRQVVTIMNGEQLYDVDLDDAELNAKLADDFKASGRRRFGYIGLQNHKKPVWFRNVRIKRLPPEGYVHLLDGEGGSDWRGEGHGSWTVADGLASFEGAAAGWLPCKTVSGDFRLKLDYRLSEGAGGGVYFGADRQNAVEVQLLDDHGASPSLTSSGALHSVVAPAQNPTKPTRGWNQLEITRKDGALSANLNIIDLWSVTLAQHEKLKGLPDELAIGLQGSGGRIEFRNAYLKGL